MTSPNQRRMPRTKMAVPGKIHIRQSDQYVRFTTVDLSPTGALVSADAMTEITPGEFIEIGVAWTDTPALCADDMIEAKVLRALPQASGHTMLALEFEHAMPIPMPRMAA